MNLLKLTLLLPFVCLAACDSKVSVRVEGFGSVIAQEKAFECWHSKRDCSVAFQQGLVLRAVEPGDGSTTFAGWAGLCSGQQVDCRISEPGEVVARFSPVKSLVDAPLAPQIRLAQGISPSRIAINWHAAKKETITQDRLSYLVYVSSNMDSLMDRSNLVSTIAGNIFGEYTFEYQLLPDAVPITAREVHIAVVGRDREGNLGEPAYQYHVQLPFLENELHYNVVNNDAVQNELVQEEAAQNEALILSEPTGPLPGIDRDI